MDTRTGQEPPRPASLSELDALRNKIGDSFKQAAGLISHIRKPIPHGTGNGTDLDEEGERWNLIRKIEGDLADLSHLSIRDIKTLIEIQHQKMTGEPTDDKTYLMEGLIRVRLEIQTANLEDLCIDVFQGNIIPSSEFRQ
jgi:linoleate 8R-lipoxygenase / 9,12-octadecadienoate 8-hydroperoxide 8R-isomerase